MNCSKSTLGKQTEKPASYRRARRLLISEAPAPPPPPAAAAAPVAVAAAAVAAADGGQDTTSSGLHRHVRRAANRGSLAGAGLQGERKRERGSCGPARRRREAARGRRRA